MVRPWTRIEKATTTKAVRMIAPRSGTRRWNGERQRQRQRAAQASPEQRMLIGRRKPPARPAEQRRERINRQGAAGEDQQDRDGRRPHDPSRCNGWSPTFMPIRMKTKLLARNAKYSHAQRTRSRPSRDSEPRADAADQQAGGKRADDSRRVEMLGEQERAVSRDGRQCDFDQRIVGAADDQQDRAADRQADRSPAAKRPQEGRNALPAAR